MSRRVNSYSRVEKRLIDRLVAHYAENQHLIGVMPIFYSLDDFSVGF